MEKKRISLTILLITILTALVVSDCPAQYQLQGIQSGVLSLQGLDKLPSDIQVTITIKQYVIIPKEQMTNPQTTLALNGFDVKSGSIDIFYLSIDAQNQTGIYVSFMYEPFKWVKVSYSYIICNRTDIVLNLVTIDATLFTQNLTADAQSVEFSTKLTENIKNDRNYSVTSFISGIKYTNDNLLPHPLVFSIIQTRFVNNTQVFINFTPAFLTQNISIEILGISLVLIDSQLIYTSSNGKVLKQNFNGKSSENLINTIQIASSIQKIFGLSKLNFTNDKLNFNSTINSSLSLSLQSSANSNNLEINYLFLAIKPSNVCQKCTNQKIIKANNCVVSCSTTQTVFKYLDGTSECRNSTILNTITTVNTTASTTANTTTSNSASKTGSTTTGISASTNSIPAITNTKVPVSPAVIIPVISITTTTNPVDKVSISNIVNPTVSNSTVNTSSNVVISDQSVKNTTSQSINNTTSQSANILANQSASSNKTSVQTQDLTANITQNRTAKPSVIVSNSSTISIVTTTQGNSAQNILDNVQKNVQSSISQDSSNQKQVLDSTTKQVLDSTTNNTSLNVKTNPSTNNSPSPIKSENKCQKISNSYWTGQACRCRVSFIQKKIKSNQFQCVLLANTLDNQCIVNYFDLRNGINHQHHKNLQIKSSQTLNTIKDKQIIAIKANILDSIVHKSVVQLDTSPIDTTLQCGDNQVYNAKTVKCQCKVGYSFDNNDQCQLIPVKVVQKPSINQAILPPSVSIVDQPCMRLKSQPVTNSANVFVWVELSQQYKFSSQQQMRKFISSSFSDPTTKASQVYCSQQEKNRKQFQCLLIYSNGVPNKVFDATFWFQKKSTKQRCELKVSVDTLAMKVNKLKRL